MTDMKETLVLLTRPLENSPKSLASHIMARASQVALVGDGVFNHPGNGDGVYGMPGGHRAVTESAGETGKWPDNWVALREDVDARKVSVDCRLIEYPELVKMIEDHAKTVSL